MGKNTTKKPLTLFERERIGVYKAQSKSGHEIARLLRRNPSTINRELKRNRQPHPLMSGYIGCMAHQQAAQRKKKAGKRTRLKNEEIRQYTQEKLLLGWSPEQIAHRLEIDRPQQKISHEAIYQYIYLIWPEGIRCLTRKHPKRYIKYPMRKRHKPSVLNRVDISMRATVVNERKEAGHWESDTVESDQSRVVINVLYERVSRLLRLTQLPNKKAKTNVEAIVSKLEKLPSTARRSITYDNGTENYFHEDVNRRLGTQSYFCRPYHSWEKGGVENSNGLLRRFLPKKTDLGCISQMELNKIEELLNNRPRKCLNFKTPLEVFVNLYGATPL